MIDFYQLRAFYFVAKEGGFSKATKEIDIKPSTLSQQVSTLEKNLGTKLFHRHHGVSLTEDGEVLFDSCKRIFSELNVVKDVIRHSKDNEIRGDLRIGTTFGLAAHWLSDNLGGFVNRYPDIRMRIACYSDNFALRMREVHAAICPGIKGRTDLIQIPLREFKFKLYASDEYLEKHGYPENVEDLKNHRILVFSQNEDKPFSNADHWVESNIAINPSNPYIVVNSVLSLFKLAENGLGIASLTDDFPNLKYSNLKQVLSEEVEIGITVYFVYSKLVENVKKIIAFREYLTKNTENLKKIAIDKELQYSPLCI